MGDVYRARDSKLKRDVAIKVLPTTFSRDSQRVARFRREAEILASLTHPCIAAIYDVETLGEMQGLVLELVDGETLSDRIARGPLDVAEALRISLQIVDGLEAAHEAGIVHRDLKPANIKQKRDGSVKVLDFGLAKVREAENPSLSGAPTMTSEAGIVLGTPAYMSPEQATGRETDRTTDIWAFGCVLYEMLTGHRVFAGQTAGNVIAEVLKEDPDWRRLPADTPEGIRRLLRRCLQKERKSRLQHIGDARIEIDEALQPDGRAEQSPPEPPPRPRSRSGRLAWVSMLILLGVAVAALAVLSRRPIPSPPEVRFNITTPEVAAPYPLSSAALSADGRQILFVADSGGEPHVWLRSVDSVTARPLQGTGGAVTPFWSPDGRSIAFYSNGFLKRLDLDGGLVRPLARAVVGGGGSWSRDGVILFVRNPASEVMRVSDEGGASTAATRVDAGQVGHGFPHFLPDGRHFLYYVTAGPDSRGIHVGQLDSSTSQRLLDADGGGVYSNGHLLFIRQTNVYAQEFDVERLQLKGSAFQVAEGVFGQDGGLYVTLSGNEGGFIFRAGAAKFQRQFTWVDRSGNVIAGLADPLNEPDAGMSWSPDRTQMVFSERGSASSDLWMLDARRGVVNRFSEDDAEEVFPVWARDGKRIIYTAIRNGQISIQQRNIGAVTNEVLIQPQADEIFATDTSPDGRYLIYQRVDPKTGSDIWALLLGGGGPPMPVVQTDADERNGRLSPDGRWIAFSANNSEVFEVYVQPFPGPGRPARVSTKGGDQPQWRPDGAELYYISLDGKLMAASMKPAADQQSLDAGTPVSLFVAGVGSIAHPFPWDDYVASADGRRFLLSRFLRDKGGDLPLRVVLNWRPAR